MLLAQVEKKLLWGRWELGNLAASKWNTGWPLTVSTLRHPGTGRNTCTGQVDGPDSAAASLRTAKLDTATRDELS